MFNTDKASGHFYLPHYQKHFRPYKFKKINLLEIGVGGYHESNSGGHSLRMWKSYFWFGKIYGLDIYDKSAIQEERIVIYKGSQVDKKLLNKITIEVGEFDLIIDDGSHLNDHVIETFNILFRKLKKGGIYVVEDTQTSYWPDKGGDSANFNNPNTLMHFFKSLADGLNYKEFMIAGYDPSYFDKHIVSIHFYHNLIFIYKGENDEPSNLVVNNLR
ncbi:class I SAM-dependent methyltransferase [Aestuariivivens sediminicola]|uniref:class I SAM-dependent methyltransferase n=1 Tax=Aestuariivivens sediminicola TaxID=2913560 RepID=UPI001F571C5C|nr:class I SAM-dependent methyltransferase [Aestuariivivens sediminicola]